MTELMKRYEAETGKSPLLPIRCGNCTSDYIAWLETKVEDERRCYQQLDEMYIVVSRAEVNQRKEAEKLKDQLRWRPVSEKPEVKGEYWTRLKMFGGNIMYDIHDFDGENFVSLGSALITHWLPIPPQGE